MTYNEVIRQFLRPHIEKAEQELTDAQKTCSDVEIELNHQVQRAEQLRGTLEGMDKTDKNYPFLSVNFVQYHHQLAEKRIEFRSAKETVIAARKNLANLQKLSPRENALVVDGENRPMGVVSYTKK